MTRLHATQNTKVLQTIDRIGGLQNIAVPEGETVPSLVAKYQKSGLVRFAEPDYVGHTASTTPNDPKYVDGTLWGLNTIDAPHGWDVLTSASNIVMAVLDTGVRYTHEDLASNMWVNPTDQSHGLNALTGTTDPNDDNGHGTQVAGVLGAVGNNSKGVVGVAWHTQIMACKCFDSFGVGNISACVTSLDYAGTNGANLINASWGFGAGSQALSNAIYSLRSAGIIVVAACGNVSTPPAINIDITPSYPASYPLDNVVSVAYTTTADTLDPHSNYGPTNVDLAAPGQNIYSTFGATDSYYYSGTGTSFAAPYVTGALALMLVHYPTDTYQQIISRLLRETDPLPSLAGKCVSGGRLNLRNALNPPIRLGILSPQGTVPLNLRVSWETNRMVVVQGGPDLTNWTSLVTNNTGATGSFMFSDPGVVTPPKRFYRAVSSP
jgi:subtilisin family serine protease